MVSLKQGDPVFGEAKLRVVAATGQYADTDLIECADTASGEATGVFQAQYIKYGPLVYQFNTPEELGAALFAVDPEATHDAVMLYKEDEARRLARTKGTLEPSEPVPAPDALTEEPPKEVKKEEVLEETPKEEEVVSEEPPVAPPVEEPVVEAPVPDDGSVLGEALVPPAESPYNVETPLVEPEVPVISEPSIDTAVDISSTTPE